MAGACKGSSAPLSSHHSSHSLLWGEWGKAEHSGSLGAPDVLCGAQMLLSPPLLDPQ